MIRRRRHWKSWRGLTLVELMIAIAVIGVLASIAIPSFIDQLSRSKMAEGPVMMRAIAQAEIAFFSTPRTDAQGVLYNPCYLGTGLTPATVSSSKRNWVDIHGGFRRLGIASSSPVYFSYLVAGDSNWDNGFCDTDTEVTEAVYPETDYAFIIVVGDLDGDGVWNMIARVIGFSPVYASVGPPPGPSVNGIPITQLPSDTHSFWTMILRTNGSSNAQISNPYYSEVSH